MPRGGVVRTVDDWHLVTVAELVGTVLLPISFPVTVNRRTWRAWPWDPWPASLVNRYYSPKNSQVSNKWSFLSRPRFEMEQHVRTLKHLVYSLVHSSPRNRGSAFPRLLQSPGIFSKNFQDSWIVLENEFGPGKSWNLPVVQLNQHAFYV